MRRIGWAAAVFVLAAPRVTDAYVWVTTPDGRPYKWAESCVFITPSTRSSPDLPMADIEASAWAAGLSWSRGTVPCTYLSIDVGPPSDAAGSVAADGINSLVFRQDRWCRDKPDKDGNTVCYDVSALALTSFFARDTDARIFDADVEVNGVNFQWAILDGSEGARATAQDLPNTLTHEFGHVIGLDHNCYVAGSTRPRGKDGDGNDAPNCGDLPAELRGATMYYAARGGDIGKRTLSPDDVAAVCAGYPIADDPGRCAPAKLPGGGCGAGGDARSSAALVLAAAATVFAATRKRRRVSRRES